MADTPRGVPPLEVRIERERMAQVGVMFLDMHEANEAERAEKKKAQGIPEPKKENWKHRMSKGTRPPGERCVEVRRIKGRFATYHPTPQEIAAHYADQGVMTAGELPPPKKLKRPED